jgi:hypothetical protein
MRSPKSCSLLGTQGREKFTLRSLESIHRYNEISARAPLPSRCIEDQTLPNVVALENVEEVAMFHEVPGA